MRTHTPHLTHVLVDHAEPLLELGVFAALRDQPGLCVQAASVRGDAEPAGRASVDVLIADYRAALDFMARKERGEVPASHCEARTVVLTREQRESEIRTALERGAYGYLLSNCSVPELVDGIRLVHRGSRYLCQRVAQSMADSLAREGLTARELDVLSLLARGDCNKEIARGMGIAVGTVKAHMKSILQKLGAESRTQALSLAVQRGLVPGASLPARGQEPARSHAHGAGLSAPAHLG